jgi:hypothetical protein
VDGSDEIDADEKNDASADETLDLRSGEQAEDVEAA